MIDHIRSSHVTLFIFSKINSHVILGLRNTPGPSHAHDDGTAYHRGGEIRLGAGDAYGLMLHDYYLANFDNVAEDPVEVVVETSPVAVGPAD